MINPFKKINYLFNKSIFPSLRKCLIREISYKAISGFVKLS